MALIVTSSPRRKTVPTTTSLEKIVRAFARRQPGNPVYLVGGAVRDRLLGLPVTDFDFAVARDEEDLARELEGAGFGRAVRISPESSPVSVWRLARRGRTADIARFEKDGSIEDDLARRDFTANAIAQNVVSGRLVDPFGGRADIRRGRIRMIAPANLDADPVRILRAYRLAAALGWTIAPRTRAALAARSASLAAEAKERIRAELVRLFGARNAPRPIAWASRDGVLAACLGLPAASPADLTRLLSPLDAPRLEERLRFPFRLATLIFRSRGASENVGTDLVNRGFSRSEASAVAMGARFLAVAFSAESARRVLFEFREQWKDLRILLRLAASSAKEKERARELALRARRCNFEPAPVDGRDIARWLAIPPGKRLGRALGRAAFLHFTGEARTRGEIERAVRSFDGARAEE